MRSDRDPSRSCSPTLGVSRTYPSGALFDQPCEPHGARFARPTDRKDPAHAGRGIGRAFLRHTERCRLLLHLINGESETPAEDLASINNELRLYSTALGRTTQVVVLTKTDLPHVAARADETLAALQAAEKRKSDTHGKTPAKRRRKGPGLREPRPW